MMNFLDNCFPNNKEFIKVKMEEGTLGHTHTIITHFI